MKSFLLSFALSVVLLHFHCAAQDWIPLFDGKSLDGWQPSENKATWRVEDGCLVSRGPRSHLFYAGPVRNHDFKNFEFEAEVKTTPASNSGIYVHTRYQETNFPATGYECQVINSYPTSARPGQYVERKMTGSIYAIHNVWKAPVKDDEWFRYRIVVQGKTIRTYINDELMAEYTESPNAFRASDKQGRWLSSGTFALQGHDPGSVVFYRNLRVKLLSDDLPTPGAPADDPVFDAKILKLSNDNFPLLDLNVQVSGGLSVEHALTNARRFGYTCGFVFSSALPGDFRKPPQAFVGLQRRGREGLDGLTEWMRANFDYILAGVGMLPVNTMRPEDPQRSMDQLVDRIDQLAGSKHINIYSAATVLSPELMPDYDKLWTPERMDRVIKTLKEGNIAMEINDRLKVPSATFIKRAKAAGVKFTFGSGNIEPNDPGKLAYCIAMIEECRLTPNDLWLPQ